MKLSGGTLVAMNDNAQRPGHGADDDSAVDGPGGRLAAYEARTEKALDLLALLTLWIVIVPPWDFGHDVKGSAWKIRIAVSVVYGIDLAIRSILVASGFVAPGPRRAQRRPQPEAAPPEVTLAELDRRLARIEQLLIAASSSQPPAEAAGDGPASE